MDTERHVGRELDAAVAKALGLIPCQNSGHCDDPKPLMCWATPERPEEGSELKMYSAFTADAFAALDAVMAKRPKYCVDVASLNNAKGVVGWTCRFTWHEDRKLWLERHGKTPAEAICRAILALEATDGR